MQRMMTNMWKLREFEKMVEVGARARVRVSERFLFCWGVLIKRPLDPASIVNTSRLRCFATLVDV
jgi:hypothetical protein